MISQKKETANGIFCLQNVTFLSVSSVIFLFLSHKNRKFESKDQSEINGMDKKVFWAGLIIWPGIWIVFFITNLFGFHFDNLVLVTMALSFAVANLVGYWKCSSDAQNRTNITIIVFFTQKFQSFL